MKPLYTDPLVTLYLGDCLEVMPTLEAESVDAIVTDPPYGLEFMGKDWDSPWKGKASREFSEIPAGAMGGFRRLPQHSRVNNLKCLVCDHWQFSSNPCKCESPKFPNAAGMAAKVFGDWCQEWGTAALRVIKPGGYLLAFGGTRTHHRLVCGLEDAGWIIRDELDWIYASGFPKGRANLKPAHEPIVLARKPGPLRPLAIDECRIPGQWTTWRRADGSINPQAGFAKDYVGGNAEDRYERTNQETPDGGRWPSNVLLSDPELFDEPNPEVVGSGATMGPSAPASGPSRSPFKGTDRDPQFYGDTGGYSRFFLVPKADRAERERGLEGREQQNVGQRDRDRQWDIPGSLSTPRANHHPTVKPIDLMRHLVRLVTPTGGVVLDPFLGSGTTALAASEEGVRCIGIEREPDYLEIAKGRLLATPMGLGLDTALVSPPNPQRARPDSKQVKWKPGNAETAEKSSWFHGTDEEPAA